MSVSVCVCVSVCLPANIFQKPHARSLLIFLSLLPIAVARSSSGRDEIQGEEAFLGGVVRAIQEHLAIFDGAVVSAFLAKGIIRSQSPIT